jgi:hypothetical protein
VNFILSPAGQWAQRAHQFIGLFPIQKIALEAKLTALPKHNVRLTFREKKSLHRSLL